MTEEKTLNLQIQLRVSITLRLDSKVDVPTLSIKEEGRLTTPGDSVTRYRFSNVVERR